MIHVRCVTAFFLALAAACSSRAPAVPPDYATHPADPTIQLGAQETLLADGALGLGYFPDEGTSSLDGSPYRIVLADGLSKSTFVIESSPGVTDPLRHLVSATQILAPGAPGSFDNGYVGVSAVYQHANGIYYGFYHAEDQENTGTIPGTSIPGYYARIGIAYSADGNNWTKGGYVIESATPKRVPDGVSVFYDQGAAEPGAIASADGKYLYLYYTEHSRLNATGGARPVLICMARADLSVWPPTFSASSGPLPSVFTKYFNGEFSSDGIGGVDSPVLSPPTNDSNTLEGHVTYSATLGKYIMIYGVDAYEERQMNASAKVSGLYAAFSDDGIAWRRSAGPLVRDFAVPSPGLSLSWEGSLLWDLNTDTQGSLVYGYSPSWGSPPHYLVGRPASLLVADNP
jgi:hypothetical protein